MTTPDWSYDISSNPSEDPKPALSNAQQVGQIFQQARQRKGYQIEDIAQNLHMRTLYIQAIEKGNLDVLPGHIYRIGFVKTYATFLGLDVQDILQKLDLTPLEASPPTFEALPMPLSERGGPSRGLVTFSICVALTIGVGYIFWQRLNDPVIEADQTALNPEFKELITAIESPPSQEEKKAPPPETSVVSNPPQPNSVTGALAQTPLIPSDPSAQPPSSALASSPVVLKAKMATWIEIRKRNPDGDSTVIVTKILAAGEEYALPSEEGLTLKTGNAGGTEVYINGENRGTFGPAGQVKRKIPLSLPELTNYLEKEGGERSQVEAGPLSSPHPKAEEGKSHPEGSAEQPPSPSPSQADLGKSVIFTSPGVFKSTPASGPG